MVGKFENNEHAQMHSIVFIGKNLSVYDDVK